MWPSIGSETDDIYQDTIAWSARWQIEKSRLILIGWIVVLRKTRAFIMITVDSSRNRVRPQGTLWRGSWSIDESFEIGSTYRNKYLWSLKEKKYLCRGSTLLEPSELRAEKCFKGLLQLTLIGWLWYQVESLINQQREKVKEGMR